MTAKQLELIAVLRLHNFPYSFIGEKMNISANTIKSICRRKGFLAEGFRKTKSEKETAQLCKNCLKPLGDKVRSDAIFCSAYCRSDWRRKQIKVVEKST